MKKLNKRFWFQIHGWASLPIWIVFCLVCLTGTIAVFSHELTWLTNPAARAINPDNLQEKSMPELISIVERSYPTAKITTGIAFEPYLVRAIVFTDTDKPQAIAYVNQFTGEIQEVNNGATFINFIRSLHAWLLFPWQHSYSVGYYLVCSMAIAMLTALISGLIIYKKFWRAFTRPKIRFNKRKKILLGDLHRTAGVWSIWFLLLMSVTGLWYLIQAILWHTDVEIDPNPPTIKEIPAATNDGIVPLRKYSLKEALLITKQKFPDFKSTYIMPPEHTRDTYKLYGKGDFIFYDQYSYGVAVDPFSGEITHIRSPQTMDTVQTLSHIANPLHYGTIGGIWTKAIWFIFGVFLTGMSVTGFWMWSERTLKNIRITKNNIIKTNELEFSS
ncbi:MAG: PepSY domain-containing protein [Kangiellaceae bacterium]|nr:PepSY domain-containing protein [Kangiellaceae bacterium]